MHTITYVKYYVAVQDGRFDDEVFDTYEEAEAYRQTIDELNRKATCVMSYNITKTVYD